MIQHGLLASHLRKSRRGAPALLERASEIWGIDFSARIFLRGRFMGQAIVVRGRKVRYAVAGVGWIAQTAFLPGVQHTGSLDCPGIVRTVKAVRHRECARKTAFSGINRRGNRRDPRPGKSGLYPRERSAGRAKYDGFRPRSVERGFFIATAIMRGYNPPLYLVVDLRVACAVFVTAQGRKELIIRISPPADDRCPPSEC